MPSAQILYDIERKKAVKNIALLKTLKSQIEEEIARPAKMNQLRLDLTQRI